jgi:uncharacterized protein involved in exopolysaccharide biosynthesis
MLTKNGKDSGLDVDSMTAPTMPAAARPKTPLDYLRAVLREHLIALVVVPFLAVLATGITTKFVLTKRYKARAILMPRHDMGNLASRAAAMGFAGELLGFDAGALQGLSSGLGGEEYIAIMKSFDFVHSLITRYRLDKEVFKPRSSFLSSLSQLVSFSHDKPSDWKLYKAMLDRFDCTYDYKSGNLTLTFIDPDRELAQKVLDIYIVSLRDQLRSREVKEAKAAVESLDDEAGKTPDSLLKGQLYELVARQVQRQKLAEVQADFAFRVIESPIAPEKADSPSPAKDCLVVMILAVLLSLSWIWLSSETITFETGLPAGPLEPRHIIPEQRLEERK